MEFLKPDYTLNAVNGDLCGDQVSFLVVNNCPKTADVGLAADGEDVEIVKPDFKIVAGSPARIINPQIKLLSPSRKEPWGFNLTLKCEKQPFHGDILEAHVTVVPGADGCKFALFFLC